MLNATPEQYVEYALTWVGITPYAFGGDSLTTGTDCSGFVMLTSEHFGYTPPRTTQGEWAGLPAGDGSVGDLVLFDVPSDGPPQPQHVGICIGNGEMVNAPHTGVLVQVDPIPNIPGSITVMGYRRLPFVTDPPVPTPTTFSPDVIEELLEMTVSDPDLAVRFAYRMCLHREVDETGYAANMAWLAAGGSVGKIWENLQDSAEGQNVIAQERKLLGL